MAGNYGIAEADVTPAIIPDHLYDQLTDYDNDGTADVDIDDVIVDAEARFDGLAGGTMTTAAHIALIKPVVIDMVVYLLHWRRAQNSEYVIPEGVTEAWKEAMRFARSEGKAYYAAEGATTPAGTPEIEHDSPDAEWGMSNTAGL